MSVVLVGGSGRPAEALPHCEEAVRLRPNEPAFVNNYANVLRLLHRFDEARDAYLKAIKLDPKLAVAHASLGLVFLELNRIDEAVGLMARAIELDPRSASYWEHLADLYGRLEHFDEAIQCWEQVLALTPDTRSQPHRSFGWALQESNRGEEAEGHYRRALRLSIPIGHCRGWTWVCCSRSEATFRKPKRLSELRSVSMSGAAWLMPGWRHFSATSFPMPTSKQSLRS